MMQFVRRLASLLLLTVSLVADLRAESDPDKFTYLDNGVLRVGADLDRGGAIGFIADVEKGSGNIVNVHDLGRWIGQSYYSGPKPFGKPHPGWQEWPWNPVSAGDVYGHPSKLIAAKKEANSLYIKSIPKQWALNNVPADCEFETWIVLEDRSIHVRNRLTNKRKDRRQYPAMDQELPFVYTIGRLHRLKTYTGNNPFKNERLVEIPKVPAKDGKAQWTTFFASEHWAALLDDEDWGLGVIHPGVVRFLGGFYGKPNVGGPVDDPNGYVAPVRQEVLDDNIVYEFRYTLVLDTVDNIRKEAYRQRPRSVVPDYQFVNDRQHWWFHNAVDPGYPIRGHLQVKVEENDPQLYGPEGLWDAVDAPTLYIRAAYHTKNTSAVVFWETTDKPGFCSEQTMTFSIVPDGKMRTYKVELSASPTYRGKIRRLRFDPVEVGTTGERVEIELISAMKKS